MTGLPARVTTRLRRDRSRRRRSERLRDGRRRAAVGDRRAARRLVRAAQHRRRCARAARPARTAWSRSRRRRGAAPRPCRTRPGAPTARSPARGCRPRAARSSTSRPFFFGSVDVEQDQVEVLVVDERQRLVAVARDHRPCGSPASLRFSARPVGDRVVVLDDQDAAQRARAAAARSRSRRLRRQRGRRMRKRGPAVEPRTRRRAAAVRLDDRAHEREAEADAGLPPSLARGRAAAGTARRSSSCSAGGMPRPLSRTEMYDVPAVGRARVDRDLLVVAACTSRRCVSRLTSALDQRRAVAATTRPGSTLDVDRRSAAAAIARVERGERVLDEVGHRDRARSKASRARLEARQLDQLADQASRRPISRSMTARQRCVSAESVTPAVAQRTR